MTSDDPAPAGPPRWRGLARFALQAAVSAGLVWTVVRRADATVLSSLISRVDWFEWSAGLALGLLVPVLSARRFQTFASRVGPRTTLASVLAVNLESSFFNLAVPGEVAGGVMRWYRVSNALGGGARALAVVLVERVFDWTGLSLIAAAGAATLFEDGSPAAALRWAVAACAGLVLAGALTFLATCRADRLRAFVLRLRVFRRRDGLWAARVSDCWDGCRRLTDDRSLVARAAVLTAGGLATSIAGSVLMARATSVSVPLVPFASATCAIVLLSQAPVTVAGVGLREASFPILLGAWAVTRESALLLGMNAFAVAATTAAIGGCVHLSGRAVIRTPASG